MLGGLWPLAGGRILKPGGRGSDGLSHDIFYVPQRPYVNTGTLQVQLATHRRKRIGLTQLTCHCCVWKGRVKSVSTDTAETTNRHGLFELRLNA